MEARGWSGFDWDDGNAWKNEKHGVSRDETEQVFTSAPLFITKDFRHSSTEERFQALGLTRDGRRLHVTFTIREGGKKIRPISARDMSRKERIIYEKAIEADSQV